ncbi:ORF6N domain-containing protein [Enterococcus sp. DIV1420a]|uniref:ORF6N domain-containing protein n=1 Tax=Enterococcus sp. DIV1420a TaxID=2774672 RepID=UPI003F1E5DB5
MNTMQITANDITTDLLIKEYQKQRVVTFKDVDELHQRPEGTARRNFNENKEYFVEGVDYFYLKGEELKELKARTNFVGPYDSQLVLITQTGYPMLTKSMNDPLSWAVQRELVNSYFNPTKKSANRPKSLNTVLRKNVTTAKYMQELGVSKGIASAKAIELTEQETGSDLSPWKALLPYKEGKEETFNPTQIGKMIKCNAQDVNNRLIEAGLQTRIEGSKYEITDAGEFYAELLPFSKNNGHNGYQIRWKKSVIELIK